MNDIQKSHQVCVSTMKLLGDYWTSRIIDALGQKAERFCDLQRAVDNCNPVTLTDRLKKLEEARLIDRMPRPDDNSKVTYALSPLGQESLSVIEALNKFAAAAK